VYAAQKAAAAAAAAAGDPGSNAPGSAAAPTGAARVNASLDVGAQMTRHARRIYVGALPPVADNLSVAVFFGDALRAIGGVSASADAAGEPVLNAYINMEKKFAFVEFRNVEECSNALALDGVVMDGQSLRVRRPNDYDPAAAAGLGPTQPSPSLNLAAVGIIRSAIGGAPGSGGALSPEDQNNPNRLFIGGLPYFLTEQMTRELVEAFGPTRSFQLVIDRDTGKSKGYAFFIYQDESVTDVACQGLHGMQMGDKTLTVQRAAAGASKPAPAAGANATAAGAAPPGLDAASLQAQAAAHLAGIGNPGGSVAVPPPPPPPPAANPASRAVSLAEMLEVDELRDDEEFADILEDMREECGKFGEVAEIVIPRPDAEGERGAGGAGEGVRPVRGRRGSGGGEGRPSREEVRGENGRRGLPRPRGVREARLLKKKERTERIRPGGSSRVSARNTRREASRDDEKTILPSHETSSSPRDVFLARV
jgi:splicing factor U2AF subunit